MPINGSKGYVQIMYYIFPLFSGAVHNILQHELLAFI